MKYRAALLHAVCSLNVGTCVIVIKWRRKDLDGGVKEQLWHQSSMFGLACHEIRIITSPVTAAAICRTEG